MQGVFEKIIEKLEEKIDFLSDCTKYGNKDAKQQEKSYSTMFMYEVADLVDDLIEIVRQEAEQYEECYKDCRDCEAYDNEKHHCPKFCKVIKETVKEIEENHNGWIPCSERLPNQDGEFTDVLITCESIADGVFVQSAEFYIATDGEPVFDALYHYERVLAWKPLPQPYQPKGE